MSTPNLFGILSEEEFANQIGQLNANLRHQNALLEVMAAEQLAQVVENFDEIVELVKDGLAEDILHVGSQINLEWVDIATNTTYIVPHDVVHYGEVTLDDGEVCPGSMFLSWHYCTPFGMPFDAPEAFYKAAVQLPAGTYNVIMGFSWGTYVVSGNSYQFTLTQPVPEGGRLAGFEAAPDTAPSNWRVKSYDANFTLIETVEVSEGSTGTNLGTFTAAGSAPLNSLHAVAFGLNRDKDSALRQWLNSDAGIGQWWTPQHDFDMPPAEASQKAGFLTGYAAEIRQHFAKVQVKTAKNTVMFDGSFDTYYDKVFSPAKEQIYNTPQIEGEGEYWEYWRRALGLSSPSQNHPTTYPAYKIYAINAKTTAQSVRLRSAIRGYGYTTWYVASGGSVGSHGYARAAHRALPSLVIARES